ncbi:Receptor kinase [Quillaja saponaria]|uniref:Receptor kinase n=1 Tax=Quillaja saponaria TaxID=32244 RepID=A0AAD7QJ77_QUISA|nr:Receptor kinase [Quillaja saponaria]
MCCLKWVPMTQKKKDIYHEEYYNPTIIPRFSYSEIHLATNGFATKNLIGKGAFASVYKAQFRSWSGPEKFRSWRNKQLKHMVGKASTCRDVYSFGIILLEMFIAKKPSEGMFDLDIFASAVSENQVLSIADPRLFNDTDQSLTQSSFATHSSGGSDGGNMISDTNAIYNWLDMK